MSIWKALLALGVTAWLSGCGGGGSSAGTPGVGPTNPSGTADVVIVLAADTISNSGTETVVATITAVDANRRGVAGVPVSVAVNANAIVSASAQTTDAAGQITATVGIGADKSNRDITLTATAGGVTRTATLKVVPGTQAPSADDLALVLSSPTVNNGGTGTVTATVTAVDRNRNVVSGIPVTISVDSNATAAVTGTTTDSAGVLKATIGTGADRSNRVVTVTATSGTLVRTASFTVRGAQLTSSASPLVVAGTAGNLIEFTLIDFNSVAMADQPITVAATGLPTQQGRTDSNGKYMFRYNAPPAETTIEVVAAAAGAESRQSIKISPASVAIDPAPEVPQSASVTPTPSVVSVNSPGNTTNQVELRALFVGANNKPIPRIRVRFDLDGNTSNTDGTVSWVGTYAYSDANGIARATFTPGQRSSPTNGVTIRMCYDIGDFSTTPANSCNGAALTARTTLTVSSEALSVSISTNNEIKQGINDLTYIKEYLVMVVDSAGVAKADAQITPSVDLVGYRKGFYSWNGRLWEQFFTLASTERYSWNGTSWINDPASTGSVMCPNEDINRNGVREAQPVVSGSAAPALSARQEDLNWNGDLDPRKSYVAVKMVGSSKTDANGLAIVQIEYGEEVATWIDFALTVSASGVAGTESRATYFDTLRASASDIISEAIPPAFRLSPFGVGTVCTDTR